ncbi:hypothetical protein, partial [Lentzea sp.]|uniref:hypothetical protein n=1 Tax=Lentzea sp. TaxID=56099 RepID=UPI002C467F89
LLNFNRVPTVVALALVWLVPLVLRQEFPRIAALAGAIGGVVASAVVVILGALEPPLVATAWQIIGVVAVQLVVVLAAARRMDRVGALFAVWLIGLAGTAVIWLTRLDGTQVDSVLATRPLQVLPVFGTVVALAGGWVTANAVRKPSAPQGLITIAVVSVAMAWWWPAAEEAAPLRPPVAAGAVINTDEAVNTWMYGGGWDRFTTVVQTNDKVFAGVRASDPEAIWRGCEALLPVLRQDFPAPPDAKIATGWQEALQALENGATACVPVFRDNGPDDGTMAREFTKGLEQLKITQTALLEAQARVVS